MYIRELKRRRTVYDVYYSPKETDGCAELIMRFDNLSSAILAMKFVRGDTMDRELSFKALRLIQEQENKGGADDE